LDVGDKVAMAVAMEREMVSEQRIHSDSSDKDRLKEKGADR